jgi:hypothetical protein
VAEQRNRRLQAWIPDPFLAVISADKPASGLALAQAFDPRVTAEGLRTERAGLFKLGEPASAGVDSAPDARPDRRPRYLVFGHGIPDSAVSWTPPTPSVICLLDPPGSKEGANNAFRWMIRGVRGVIAPAAALDRPAVDALMAGALKSFGQEGGNPIEALTVSKRAFLSAGPKGAAPGVTEAHYHPAVWTQVQAWLVIP